MKRFLLSVVLATTLAFTSCQFDDSDIWDKLNEYGESIRDHEQRISALEELCKQMNTNIEALQALVDVLKKRDYVTNVSEVRSNGEVIGYTISFANSDTVTIYHGQDGKDGQDGTNGKDGYTPQIGVMKDTDGIYYWTLDGEWLLDAKGNKIKAVGTDGKDGVDGTNGTNGQDGKDGADGVKPQLKIENDYWYVSYDNGATWEQLGKATGEDGVNGDSIFKNVTQDDEYVYFNLADGTMMTLPKHDKENIQFEDLRVKAICCKNWDTNNDGELSYAEAAAVRTLGNVFSKNTNIIAFTELEYFTGITAFSNKEFLECKNLWKIKLPKNLTEIESGYDEGAFSDTSISNIVIPKSLKILGDYTFYYCKSLTNIVLSDNLSTIGKCAFGLCESLKEITIPNSVTSIEEEAFYFCRSLKKAVISDNVNKIGESAFYGCESLEQVNIPTSLTVLEIYTFAGCYSLASITIPSSVTHIESLVFDNCDYLRSIYCMPTTPPAISYDYGYVPFPFNKGLKIYVPRDAYDTYISYSSYKDNTTQPQNWSIYKSYIEPYDFE